MKHHFQAFFLWIFVGMGFSLGFAAPADAAVLQQGSTGTEVAHLQQALLEKGYAVGEADGIYGPLTYKAVKQLQLDRGLRVDGIAGPATAKALQVSADDFTAVSSNTAGRTLWVTATGYCPCNICNYPYGGQPSYLGHPLTHGIAAVDPDIIAMGSSLYIPGYGQAIASDQGNAIVGNRIDLCFATHQEALQWGIQKLAITIYE